MKRILLSPLLSPLLLVFGAAAQSLAPTSCTITSGVAGLNTGWACPITLTAIGGWTVTNDDSALPHVHVCTYNSATQLCPDTASGTGNATLRAYAVLDEYQTAGTFTRTVHIAGIAFPVMVAINPRHAAPLAFDAAGDTYAGLVAKGCSYSDAQHVYTPYPDKCPWTGESPQASGFDVRTIGSTTTDPVFGTSILTLANGAYSYSALRMCSVGTPQYCSVQASYGDPSSGFFVMETGHTTPAFPSVFFGQPDFFVNRALNATYNLGDNMLWQSYTGVGIYQFPMGNYAARTLIWPQPAELSALQRNPQDHANSEGWITMWGCLATQSCPDLSVNLTVAQYRYIYTVPLYQPANFCRFDMQDARVSYSNATTMSTRDISLSDFDANGWSYVLIAGAAYPMEYIRFKRDCTWEWLGPRFTSSFTSSGSGTASNWTLQSDCAVNGWNCSGGGHHAQFNTGFYPGNWTPYWNAFIGAHTQLYGETLTSKEAYEVGGEGPRYFGGMTEDHPTCAQGLPLCVSAIEAGLGTDANNVTQTLIASTTGTNIVNLTDSSLGALTTANYLSIGCDTNPWASMRGRFPITNVAGLAITLGGTFNGSDYSTAPNLAGYSHYCYAVKDQIIDHSQEGVALTRFDINGIPIQIWLVSKIMGIRAGGYASENHPQLTPDGKWVLWNSNVGYPNGMLTLASQVPAAMQSAHQEEFAPGYAARMDGAAGSIKIAARVPDTASITCMFSRSMDLSSPTTVVLAGPDVERTGTASVSAGNYYWRCTTSNGDGRLVAVGSAAAY